MANEYLIQKTTLTAIANAIREKLGEKGYTIDPAYISVGDADGGVLAEAAAISYVEYVDYTDGSYNGVHVDDVPLDSFRWYNHVKDNNDVSTLVLYKTTTEDQTYQDQPDVNEPFFHIGRVELGGVEYDKWRKIEMNPDGQNIFTWDGAHGEKYIYTNVITVPPTNAIGPLDMPAKIMSISGGEDLSAELAAQDELIADIKTAVAGKAGGGGGEVPTLVTVTICNWTSSTMTARYTGYENGVATPTIESVAGNSELVIIAIDQTTLCITSTSSFSCDGRSGGLDYIGGDSTCEAYVIDTTQQSGETSMMVDFS